MESTNLVAQDRGPDTVAGGFRRLIEGGFGVKSVPVKNREKAHGWKGANRGYRARSKRWQDLSLFCDERGRAVKTLPYDRAQRGGRDSPRLRLW